MGLFACCARCGLSVQVLDLGQAAPRCPSCAGPLEEIPDADVVTEAPRAPAPPPADWARLGRGLGLVRRGLGLFFAGWGLLVLAAVALLVFRMADRDRADDLLDTLVLLANLLAVAVCGLIAAGRWVARGFDGTDGPGGRLARLSAVAAALALVPWLGLLVLGVPAVGAGPLEPLIGWLVALTCTGLSELLFLLLLREVGRRLGEPSIGGRVGRLLAEAGAAGGLAVLAFAALVVLGILLPPGRGGVTPLAVSLAVLGAVVLFGVGSTALVARYRGLVGAVRRAAARPPAPGAW